MPDNDASVLWPDGRVIYYEGDDPAGFRQEMQERYGFDPAGNTEQFAQYLSDNYGDLLGDVFGDEPFAEEQGYPFWCPPDLMEAIYESGKYQLGS